MNKPIQDIALTEESWDYVKAKTKYFTHCFHSYPAMMIPQVARRLIATYGPDKPGGTLFDPFCGTGTSLVEGVLSGLKVIGTDINPLATLIAETKCKPVDLNFLRNAISDFNRHSSTAGRDEYSGIMPDFKNLTFWFNEPVISKLSGLRAFIEEIEDVSIRRFFQVAFSETVREVSLTKSGEFKLVRKAESVRDTFSPDVDHVFSQKIERNFTGLSSFIKELNRKKLKPDVSLYQFNTVEGIPKDILKPKSVDIVVTSPPYGDSSTTVAYGQFSRLSNQWLGVEDAFQIDKKLMGGITYSKNGRFDVQALDGVIKYIEAHNKKRALSVAAFYKDLEASTKNVARVVKLLGHVCYVVSNRRVQGILLPTDLALREFFRRNGFEEVNSHERRIPNKRMPLRNSPTNIPGRVEDTMTKEFIVVMQKRRHIE